MTPKSFQAKFIAAFLWIFVCMNAGGAVCVAYCRSVVLSAKGDHCPLAKKGHHCDRSSKADSDEPSISAVKFDCCPMIVSFIPGTLEPKQTFDTATAAVPASNLSASPIFVVSRNRFQNIPAYRGPPKDERVLHITNRILRI